MTVAIADVAHTVVTTGCLENGDIGRAVLAAPDEEAARLCRVRLDGTEAGAHQSEEHFQRC